MPGGYLPLNIFEQRYLDMIRDAMRGEQLIGMVQPKQDHANASLHQVGTCARIVQYEETQDGRYNIVLKGLCRFKIERELQTVSAYRIVVPIWSEFKLDYEEQTVDNEELLAHFRKVLKRYLDQLDVDLKWKTVADAMPAEQLVNSSVCYLPIDAQDKQLLLETNSLGERITAFTTILEMGEAEGTRH